MTRFMVNRKVDSFMATMIRIVSSDDDVAPFSSVMINLTTYRPRDKGSIVRSLVLPIYSPSIDH